jgi:hypothetical protein
MAETLNINTRSKTKAKRALNHHHQKEDTEFQLENINEKREKEDGIPGECINHGIEATRKIFQNTDVGKIFTNESNLLKFQNEIITQAKFVEDCLAFTPAYRPIHSTACRDVYFYEMGRSQQMPMLWTKIYQKREQIQKEHVDFQEFQRLKEKFSKDITDSSRQEGRLHYFNQYVDSNYNKRVYISNRDEGNEEGREDEEAEEEEDDEEEPQKKKKGTVTKKSNLKRKKSKENANSQSKKTKL